MYLNRLCIDEEAAFESTGVYSLKELEQIIMWQEMRRLAENKSEDLTLHFVYTAKLFKRRECNNCWEAQPNRPLLHSRRLNNDHYIKTFSVVQCNNHHYCKKFRNLAILGQNFLI